MQILEKTSRFTAIAVASLFIALNVVGILGVWFVNSAATDVVLKGYGLVETGVGVVEAGVGRVDNLIATSRTEVRQAAETITAVGARAQANSPVLNALSDRLETRLSPRITQVQQVLSPVRDAVGAVGNAVSLVNSMPMMADRAPRLAALDDTFNRLEGLGADAAQLRGTLRALVVEQKNETTAETVATLVGLTERIDTRLGEVQANVDGVQAEITALQLRMESRKSQVLFTFNLLALVATLMLIWMLYSQVVVIQHHWRRVRQPAAAVAEAAADADASSPSAD